MATYEYIAKNAAGEEVVGVMQGESQAAVIRTLDEKQLFPVRVRPKAGRQARAGGGKVRLRDVGLFYSQLADLLGAGVPLLRALETLARATPKPGLKQVVLKVREDVSGGKTLAEAMAGHPQAFPSLHSAMVKAGEKAGFLEDVLANMAAFLERVDDLRSKVRNALVYPMILTVLGLAAMVFILTVLVPQFEPVFEGIALPLPTRLLFSTSDVLRHHWGLMAGVLLLGVIGVRGLLASEIGRETWDRWKLKIPMLGKTLLMLSITRFCRILGTMLANGVPIIQALQISKDAAGLSQLAKTVEQATENVRAGQPLAEPLRASGLFPGEVIEMIAVAEESNQMEKVLVEIADTVERRTNRQVDVAVKLIEPLILVSIAAVIGFMAVGLYYPIFNMAQTMR